MNAGPPKICAGISGRGGFEGGFCGLPGPVLVGAVGKYEEAVDNKEAPDA